jgi:hypothetical protein
MHLSALVSFKQDADVNENWEAFDGGLILLSVVGYKHVIFHVAK